MNLVKPSMLKLGDKIATISLSWGGAGDSDILWRYNAGKKRLQEEFGLQVVEMPHTLSGSDYIYSHPEKRAEDLMAAFEDKSIKAVFSCIGGYESIRIVPYIDFDIIRNNPKIFMGYSDTTISHLICLKAGISSFYGPAILSDFAENVEMFDYTKHWIKKVLFDNSPIGRIDSSPVWTSELLPWEEKNKFTQRKMQKNDGYDFLQGKGIVRGQLIGGCIEVLETAKGTEIWPSADCWNNAVIFFETSEEKPDPWYFEHWLRNYGAQGILQKAKAVIFGKPYDNLHYEEYKKAIVKVIRDELKLYDLPVVCNVNFGHAAPIITIPYGTVAEIDCNNKIFSIVDSGVI